MPCAEESPQSVPRSTNPTLASNGYLDSLDSVDGQWSKCNRLSKVEPNGPGGLGYLDGQERVDGLGELTILANIAKYYFPIRKWVYEPNSIVNSVCVDDWTVEMALIASNDVLGVYIGDVSVHSQ